MGQILRKEEQPPDPRLSLFSIISIGINTLVLTAILVVVYYKCHTDDCIGANTTELMNFTEYITNISHAAAPPPLRTCYNRNKAPIRHLGEVNRIIGGKTVPLKSVPSMAGIVVLEHDNLVHNSLQCGAVIIDQWWVATAAQCIQLLRSASVPENKIVVVSGNKRWSRGRKHPIASMIVHPSFDKNELFDDIGLISVRTPFKGRYEKPAALASFKYAYRPNVKVRVVGWGVTSNGSSVAQEVLQAVDAKLIGYGKCISLYADAALSSSMVCAGEVQQGGQDACQFDSGGPLYHKDVLIGIVSWGKNCGLRENAGVYTKVGRFQNWITRMGINPKIKPRFRTSP